MLDIEPLEFMLTVAVIVEAEMLPVNLPMMSLKPILHRHPKHHQLVSFPSSASEVDLPIHLPLSTIST